MPASDIEAQWSVPASMDRPITFTYDRLGYRNSHEIDQADVVLLGDSYVEGWYVSDDEVASSVMEPLLGRAVANLGVSGYGGMQELVVLKTDATRFGPKVVVWFFFEGNDLYNDQEFEKTLLYVSSNPEEYVDGERVFSRQTWQQRSFVLNAVRALRSRSARIVPSRIPYFGALYSANGQSREVYFQNYASVPWSDWLSQRWLSARAALEEGHRWCRERGIRLLVCYIPIKFRVYQPYVRFSAESPCRQWTLWPLPDLFTAFCMTSGIPSLDLTELFQNAVASGEMPYATADTHWGPEGHALVARRLAEEISRRGWLATNGTIAEGSETAPIGR